MTEKLIDLIQKENDQFIKTAEYRWIIPRNKTLMFHVDLPESDRNWGLSGQIFQIEVEPGGVWNAQKFPRGFLPYRTFFGDINIRNLYTLRVSEPLQVLVRIETPHMLMNVKRIRELIKQIPAYEASKETWQGFIDLLPTYSSLMRPDIVPVNVKSGEPIPLGSLEFTPMANKTEVEVWILPDSGNIRIKMFENSDDFNFNKNSPNKAYKMTLQVGSFVLAPQLWGAGLPDRLNAQEITFQKDSVDITFKDMFIRTEEEEVVLEETHKDI